jgi:two-component system response regulator AtoC
MTRILVAEDSPDQCEFLSESLMDAGYHVDIAATGMAASKKLESNHYDMAVLDVRMPIKDGLTVLKEVRQHKPLLPVIIMTAFATSDDARRFVAHGASASLSKPFGIDELLELVAGYCKELEE